MATKILDSWALIAFFEDEPAAEQVEKTHWGFTARTAAHNVLTRA